MRRGQKIIISTFTGLIVALAVFVAARLWVLDFSVSIIPGWHTSALPTDIEFAVLALVILTTSLLTYLVLTGLSKWWLMLQKNSG